MKINYDSVADAMYFRLKEVQSAQTVRVNDHLIVDLSSAGDVVGIELLNVSSAQGKELEKNIRDGVPVNIISATPLSA